MVNRISLGTDLCSVRNRSFCTLFLMKWKITFAIARTAPLVGKQIFLQRAGMHLRQCQGDSPNNGSLEWTWRYWSEKNVFLHTLWFLHKLIATWEMLWSKRAWKKHTLIFFQQLFLTCFEAAAYCYAREVQCIMPGFHFVSEMQLLTISTKPPTKSCEVIM